MDEKLTQAMQDRLEDGRLACNQSLCHCPDHGHRTLDRGLGRQR